MNKNYLKVLLTDIFAEKYLNYMSEFTLAKGRILHEKSLEVVS